MPDDGTITDDDAKLAVGDVLTADWMTEDRLVHSMFVGMLAELTPTAPSSRVNAAAWAMTNGLRERRYALVQVPPADVVADGHDLCLAWVVDKKPQP